MPDKFHHERLFRGEGAVEKLAAAKIVVCGAGALGSNIIESLVRQGFENIHVIDHDRVEEHNVSTQIYAEGDVGVLKVDAVRNRMFRVAGVELHTTSRKLEARTAARMLKDADLVIDTFDNSASRSAVQQTARELGLPTLHAGMFEGYGEIIWDEMYRVPSDVGDDVCDYPLARNLVLLTATIAAESIVRFVLSESRESWSITLGDMAIRPIEH